MFYFMFISVDLKSYSKFIVKYLSSKLNIEIFYVLYNFIKLHN